MAPPRRLPPRLGNLTGGALEYLIHHVVLPPKLPQEDDSDASHEHALLDTTIRALRKFRDALQTVSPEAAQKIISVISTIDNLSRSRNAQGVITAAQISVMLHKLSADEATGAIPLEVKAQNAGIIVSRMKDDVIFEVFELSPENGFVMSTKGRMVRSFPSYVTRIPIERFREEGLIDALSGTIATMSFEEVEEFQPKVRKGGGQHSETRDTANPSLVTDYLINVLSAFGGPMSNAHCISKNTREDVLWSDALLPWRRSPLWLLIRVAMQLEFSRNATESLKSLSLYKAAMVQVVTGILDVAKSHPQMIGPDLLHVISAKLTRRLRKLKLLQSKQFYELCAESARTSLLQAYHLMNKKWAAVMGKTESNIDLVAVGLLRPEYYRTLTIPWLDKFIQGIGARDKRSSLSTFRPTSASPHVDKDKLPNDFNASGEHRFFQLATIEKWVQDHLSYWLERHLGEETTCDRLRQLIENYHRLAGATYGSTDIPRSNSIMYLTVVELWIACDKSACHLYPLLKDFDPEINAELLQYLSLPFKSHLVRLDSIEKYLFGRRRESTEGAPSVFRDFGHAASFAVKYFDQSSEHQELKKCIERQAETDRRRKVQELETKKKEYHQEMAQSEQLTCEDREIVYDQFNGYTRTEHSPYCHKCALQTNANAISIEIFEWPLSPIDPRAKATVFELQIPEAFSQWRDTTIFLLMDVLHYERNHDSRARARYTIRDHADLSHLASMPSRQRIDILSEVKPLRRSHYKGKANVSFLTEENVCVKSALQYHYFDKNGEAFTCTFRATDKVQKKCTYKLPRRSNKLQRFLQADSVSDTVTPNSVIASLADCPIHFSLDEYKAFGALPIGYNIVYSNIVTQLAVPIVDFAKVETQCLVMQIIHQAGPSSESHLVERLIHQVLTDESLCAALLKEIEASLPRLAENWESWRALATLIQLSLRMYELTESLNLRSRCARCLESVRKISLDWLGIIKLRSTSSTDDTQRTELQSRATEIALLSVSTLDVDEASLKDMILLPGAVSSLIRCSVVVQENKDSTSTEHTFLHRAMLQSWRSLLFRGLNSLREGILNGNLQDELNKAVSASWDKFKPSDSWRQYQHPHQQWLHTNCINDTGDERAVHFNLLTAELLVNGLPLSKLPREYTDHDLYSMLFDQASIEVVPTGEPGMEFSAKGNYRDFELSFGMDGSDMLVVATRANKKYDLLSPHYLEDALPAAFVDRYSHWYNHYETQIEFRPRNNPWSWDADFWVLKKAGSTWRLSKARLFLVNPNSSTGQAIADIFAPLDHRPHIHIFFDESSSGISIELPRLQLGFNIDHGASAIQSRQYRGMIIDSDQRFGSLVGLSNKLVLRHMNRAEDRMVLIPQGPIKYGRTADHVAVEIDLNYSTRTHAYQIDPTLARLMDNGSLQSKLFLAYLHALTSYCLPDSLTSHTGTEAALRILRSAAVASFDRLTQEDISLLKLIADLTPKRSYYPEHLTCMQQVAWDGSLSFASQHSEFTLEVERHFEEARKGRLFYADNEYIEPSRLNTVHPDLLRRHMIRSSSFCVDGFGAEHYSCEYDKIYQGRALASDRGQNSGITATLLLRQEPNLHSKIHAEQFRRSLRHVHLQSSTVHGPGTQVLTSSLKYSAKWLEELSSYLPRIWCSLHASLPTSPSNLFNKFSVMMWLSIAAFSKNVDLNVIQAVVAFYKIPEMASIGIPQFHTYDLSKGDTPNMTAVQSLVRQTLCSFKNSSEYNLPRSSNESMKNWTHRKKKLFESKQNGAVESFENAILSQWPCERPTKPTSATGNTYFNTDTAISKVLPVFKSCFENRGFYRYVSDMADILQTQPVRQVPGKVIPKTIPSGFSQTHSSHTLSVKDIFSLQVDASALPAPPEGLDVPLEQHVLPQENQNVKESLDVLCNSLESLAVSKCEKDYVSYLHGSCDSLAEQDVRVRIRAGLSSNELTGLLQQYATKCRQHFLELSKKLVEFVRSCGDVAACTGHCPRVSPTFWLQQLNRDGFECLNEGWKSVVIKYGLAVTELHRAERLLTLAHLPQELAEELQNRGHQNWSPREFPETLLLEAESGILVRSVQEDIATQMRNPPDAKNSVMQLNMGEGKSSVIVPIVSAALADKNTLVRVIVAKPQSKQMLQMLISKLGGLLNRRIYHMPFSRALKLSINDANVIGAIYAECMANRGILLVQPEHLLSFQLMSIEFLAADSNESNEIGRSLIKTQDMFDKQSRDIVDESDENFSVKFELVYTMGTQGPIELSPERWTILHSLLVLVSRYAAQVKRVLPSSIEFDDRWEHKGRYPRVRILRNDAEVMLLDHIAEHICKIGFPRLPVARQKKSTQDSVYRYIREPDLSAQEIKAVENGDFWTESTKDSLLLVRGLIAGGVMRFALGSKRWRVNYGGDATRTPNTKLAVPYRSKDSPSPRSEFSHPDVVIMLTSLTYYYGGLDDDELFDTFTHLDKSDQADAEYGEWVRSTPALPEAFRRLSGVNIKDRYICISQVFPLLRYSKGAIDYFLAHVVFPKEMKEFPQKLSASGWDIGVAKSNPTTGFSGTNDSRHVLPLSVEHLDLQKQKHTNALVMAYVLQVENGINLLPPRGGSGEASDADQLLKVINNMEPAARVILDVGAQILELNNHQVAEAWLRMSDTQTTKAVVFFDNEELSVIDRTGRIELLQTSPFAKHLDDCLVYLDEAHTRGTDLKLPKTYRAAVTLGANLTKDRLVQACMRMRKLGKGQSVVFCIPEEIQTKISECTSAKSASNIQLSDVLVWAISETWADMRRSMPLWATQGRRFESHKHLLNGVNTSRAQAKQFLEDEAQSIEHRYRPRLRVSSIDALEDWDMSNLNIAQILKRCQDFETLNFDSATLQEEQERELAPEIEEERQVQRPPAMMPEKHELHVRLINLVNTGKFAHSEAYMPAFQALTDTGAANHFALAQFPTDLLVTKDFIRTVKKPAGKYTQDSYLRPVQWVLSFKETTTSPCRLLILSPFEADQLLPRIRQSPYVTLHLYAPRPNLDYKSLDKLNLYHVGQGAFGLDTVSRSLTLQLNLFAGQLYFDSFAEYTEFCGYLGLAWNAAQDGQTVQADGFVTPPMGKWGLKKSAVKFFRELMKIRREGEGIEKTQVGRILNGDVLEPSDF